MHPEPVAPPAGQKGSFVAFVASHTAEMPGWPCWPSLQHTIFAVFHSGAQPWALA